jgi:hypothetical protein
MKKETADKASAIAAVGGVSVAPGGDAWLGGAPALTRCSARHARRRTPCTPLPLLARDDTGAGGDNGIAKM